MGKWKHSSQEREAICIRYQAGETTVQLAEAYGTSPTVICSVLDGAGIARRSRKGVTTCPFSAERLAALYLREKKSARQIGEMIGRHCETVRDWLEQLGIPRRTRWETIKAMADRGEYQFYKPSPEQLKPGREAFQRWKEEHPEQVRAIQQKACTASNRNRRLHARVIKAPCGWCGAAVNRPACERQRDLNRGGTGLVFCNHRHRAAFGRWHRWHPEGARPLIVMRLRDLMSEPGFRSNSSTPFPLRVERMENAGEQIGATDAEYAEIMAEWASGS